MWLKKVWEFVWTWSGLKLIQEFITDDSGRPSLIKFLVLVGYGIAFWIVIKLTLTKAMTDTIFTVFVGAIGVSHLGSKGLDRLKDQNSDQP